MTTDVDTLTGLRTLRFTVPATELPWGDAGNTRDDHWGKRKARRERNAETVRFHARTAWLGQTKAMGRAVVRITFAPNDLILRDPDNIGAEHAKAIIDAIVDLGVLPDDNWRHVDAVELAIDPDPKAAQPQWLVAVYETSTTPNTKEQTK